MLAIRGTVFYNLRVKRKQTGEQEERRRLDGPIHGNIKDLRESLGMTQLQLAARMSEILKRERPRGVDKSNISHWENGFSRPDHDLLPALAKALKTTIDSLFKARRRAA